MVRTWFKTETNFKKLEEGSNEKEVVGPFELLTDELHKPTKRKFERRRVIVFEIDDIWGADLVEVQEWSQKNKGFRYMLNIIDIFSKFVWCIPLKDKTGQTVSDAFKQVVKETNRQPQKLWVDEGKEFYNKLMNDWLKENDIERYSSYGEHKSAIVERFNRTLKEMMWKRFDAENTTNWIDMIDGLISKYNNRIHSTIGMTPVQASLNENEALVKQNTLNKIRNISKSKIKFKVGDKVRISRKKGLFEQGYLANWSEALYIVDKIQKTNPVTYILKDLLGETIKGGFYNEELQKSNQEVYRVEKVLRKKKIDGVEYALVKWNGYSDKFNEWIPIEDTQKL